MVIKLAGCFLIPYLLCLVVAGVPVLVMEIGLGQFTSQGGITAWKICPLFQGGNQIVVVAVVVVVVVVVVFLLLLFFCLFFFGG